MEQKHPNSQRPISHQKHQFRAAQAEPEENAPLSAGIVVDAFRAREEAIRSFEVRWSERTHLTGSDSRGTGAGESPPSEPPRENSPAGGHRLPFNLGKREPLAETKFERQFRLAVEDDKARFTETGESPYIRRGELSSYERDAAYNGHQTKDYTPRTGDVYPQGLIAASDETKGLEYKGSFPLVMNYRGYSWLTEHTNVRRLRQTTLRRETIDGVEYVVLEVNSDILPGLQYTCWLMEDRSFLPKRIEVSREGKRLFQLDIQYQQDDEARFFPISWTRSDWKSNGSHTKSVDATVSVA